MPKTEGLSDVGLAALEYARRGWWVLPLHTPAPGGGCSCRNRDCTNPGKHPRTRNGLNDATVNLDRISSWWEMYPNANIGIACGPSGLVVVDVDPRHGGDESWRDVVSKLGDHLRDTCIAQTGGGGEHYLYTCPPAETVTSFANSDKFTGPLGAGVDVRAQGGYIVAPPSIHASGALYQWEDDREPVVLPFALLERLHGPRNNANLKLESTADILAGVSEGARDYTLFRLAARLRAVDIPLAVAYSLIEQAATNCSPPFPLAEARKKVESAYRRYEPGVGSFSEPTSDPTTDDDAASYATALIDWSTFWQRDQRAEDWMCDPIIPRSRSVAIYAKAKQGKSLLILDIAARLATGRRVFDRPEGDPLDVVYFDLEMTQDDVFDRLSDMGYGPDVDLSRLHYYSLPMLPPLDTAAGGDDVMRIVRAHKTDLVVIDTTSRVLSGGENDADTLRALYMYTGQRLKAEGITVVRLDHAGKDAEKGQRGTSAKNDDVDLVWELTAQEDGGIRLKATHRRQSWIPETVELLRLDDPFRHERAAITYPPRTMETAALLDRLNIPLDMGRGKVQEELAKHGEKVRTSVLTAAIKYRKTCSQNPGTGAGTGPKNGAGTGSGNRPEHEMGTGAGTGGNRSIRVSGNSSPPLGGNSSQPHVSTDLRGYVSPPSHSPRTCADCGDLVPSGWARCRACASPKAVADIQRIKDEDE